MRNCLLMDCFYDPPSPVSSKAKVRARLKAKRSRFGGAYGIDPMHSNFRCAHCAGSVSTSPLLSGVNNRNHCPYCLWSRHLDLYQAGDRLAACKGLMQPVGLTVKRIHKKYGQRSPGELMLVHLCVECGKLSINRTAADDDCEGLLDIFEGSHHLDLVLRNRFECSGIDILGAADVELVSAQLMGLNVPNHSEKCVG